MRKRFPVTLPAGGYLLLTGQLQSEENLAWARSRDTLIEMPPPRQVTLIESPGQAMAQRFIRLALESYEGNEASKPLNVQRGSGPTGREDVVVAPLTQWPKDNMARKLRDFARNGGTVILALEPGLEDLWANLPVTQKQMLAEMLPSEPLGVRVAAGEYNPSVVAAQDWLLAGLTDEQFQLKKIAVRHFVPFAPVSAREVTTLLRISPAEPATGGAANPWGLLFRRNLGKGMVYTLSTLPDQQYTDLATRYTFFATDGAYVVASAKAERSEQRGNRPSADVGWAGGGGTQADLSASA